MPSPRSGDKSPWWTAPKQHCRTCSVSGHQGRPHSKHRSCVTAKICPHNNNKSHTELKRRNLMSNVQTAVQTKLCVRSSPSSTHLPKNWKRPEWTPAKGKRSERTPQNKRDRREPRQTGCLHQKQWKNAMLKNFISEENYVTSNLKKLCFISSELQPSNIPMIAERKSQVIKML